MLSLTKRMRMLDTSKIKENLKKMEELRLTSDKESFDKEFSTEQNASLKDTIQGAILYLLDNLDQSKDVKVLEAPSDPALQKVIEKLTILDKSTRSIEPTDLKPLIEATKTVVEAVQAIPEPKEVKIPTPIDYGPSMKHIAGQLEKLNRKELSTTYNPTIMPATPDVHVDLQPVVDAQIATNERLDAMAGLMINQPRFPTEEFMFVLRDIQESLDFLARRPQAVAGTGGGTGGSTPAPTPSNEYDTGFYETATYA